VPLSTVKTRNVHIFFTAFDFYFKWFCQSDCNNGTGGASGRKGVKNNCNTATDKEIAGFKDAAAGSLHKQSHSLTLGTQNKEQLSLIL